MKVYDVSLSWATVYINLRPSLLHGKAMLVPYSLQIGKSFTTAGGGVIFEVHGPLAKIIAWLKTEYNIDITSTSLELYKLDYNESIERHESEKAVEG